VLGCRFPGGGSRGCAGRALDGGPKSAKLVGSFVFVSYRYSQGVVRDLYDRAG